MKSYKEMTDAERGKWDWAWGKVEGRKQELIESGHPDNSQTLAYAVGDCKKALNWAEQQIDGQDFFKTDENSPERR